MLGGEEASKKQTKQRLVCYRLITMLFDGRFTAGFQGLMQRGTLPGPFLPGEAAQLAAAANLVRDNVVWSDVETDRGKYDFRHTDELLAEYERQPEPPRWMLTLAYSNPLYDSGRAPHTAEAVAAFSAFAVAAVGRYSGRGILWEIWCEPNGVFWNSEGGNVTEYIALTLAVAAGVEDAGLGADLRAIAAPMAVPVPKPLSPSWIGTSIPTSLAFPPQSVCTPARISSGSP